MRIATWNVNGLRARMDFVTHWLKRREPDVVGLQEVKVSDEDFPHDDFRALGYHAVVHGEKGWNGVAVLSRTPAEADTRGLPGREDDGARLLRVRVAGLDFATAAYCPNGKTRCGTTSPARTGTPRSSSAATSTSCRRRSTAGRGMPPTVRYSARPRSGPGTDRSSIWGSRTCFATCTRRNGSSPGGITGAARSTAAWAAHRPAARRPGRGLARAPRGDRPRVPQEEGRAPGVRSRAGVRGSGPDPGPGVPSAGTGSTTPGRRRRSACQSEWTPGVVTCVTRRSCRVWTCPVS